jgi:DNA-binding response OmpR family regulator
MRVLLIEDNPDDALLIRRRLAENQEASIELEHADCLATGLARLGTGAFDLILTDLGLPDSQALETVTRLTAVAKGVPLIVVTGTYQDGALAIEAIRKGAEDYIVKEGLNGVLLVRSMRFAMERKGLKDTLEATEADLQGKVEELQRLNRFMLDREERILEMKREVNDLLKELNKPPRYNA